MCLSTIRRYWSLVCLCVFILLFTSILKKCHHSVTVDFIIFLVMAFQILLKCVFTCCRPFGDIHWWFVNFTKYDFWLFFIRYFDKRILEFLIILAWSLGRWTYTMYNQVNSYALSLCRIILPLKYVSLPDS